MCPTGLDAGSACAVLRCAVHVGQLCCGHTWFESRARQVCCSSLFVCGWVQTDTLVGAHMAFRELSDHLQGISGHLCRYLISASPCLPPVPMPRGSLEYVAGTWGLKTQQSVSRTRAKNSAAGTTAAATAAAGWSTIWQH